MNFAWKATSFARRGAAHLLKGLYQNDSEIGLILVSKTAHAQPLQLLRELRVEAKWFSRLRSTHVVNGQQFTGIVHHTQDSRSTLHHLNNRQ